jgi:hypothetical protein
LSPISQSDLQPFPKLSKYLKDKFQVDGGGLKLRRFGYQAEDLEIDFYSASLPELVTTIIRGCTISKDRKIPPDDFFWNLAIGQRIECMIRIVMSDPSQCLVTVLKCKEEQCKEKFELSLSQDNIFDKDKSSYSEDFCTINICGSSLQLRRPTGLDQLSWSKLKLDNAADAASAAEDQTDLLKQMVIDLMCNSSAYSSSQHIKLASYDTIEEIGKNMSKIDRLVAYSIELKCPICGIKNFYEVNLEELSLMCLRKIQRELLESIHKLALAYHWTEAEILALPNTRRKLYLSMLESGGSS